ncbi:MAG TPA: hypothetical protein VMU10_11180 [Desulfomonilia bacterium]|nr:hypothetical protein [Desulfomonilia bacterium]
MTSQKNRAFLIGSLALSSPVLSAAWTAAAFAMTSYAQDTPYLPWFKVIGGVALTADITAHFLNSMVP